MKRPPMLNVPHTTRGIWPARIGKGRFAASVRRDSPAGCQIALLGLPDDTGVKLNHGRVGAAGGPRALRAALAGYGAAHAHWPTVYDAGDVVPARSLEQTHERVTAATAVLLAAGLFPVAIGGGHDLTFPLVRAVAAQYPRPTGLYFDAHLDVRETPGSGMPFRKLIEECQVPALHLHGFRSLVNTAAHQAWFLLHGGKIHPEGAKVALPRGKHLFVSLDLDVLDAAHAPGVSAPNPAGWTVRQVEPWVRACGASPRVRCFDIMELNPRFDSAHRTARSAAHLLLTFLEGYSHR